MNDIIKRLENVTGPDRELDEAIHILITGKPTKYSCEHCGTTGMWFPQSYTVSIDAALTLVPQGMVAGVTTEGRAIVTMPHNYWENDFAGGFCETGATPAIALCIAALKAHLLSKPDL